MRISSHVASLAAQRAMSKNDKDLSVALKQLASGRKFVSASVDPAGLAVSEGLRAQTRGYQAALANTENATSFVQVAEGALAEQSNIVIRLRELAVQAASDTLSDTEREFLNDEYQQLTSELDRIAKSTKFGQQSLLDGNSKSYEFQVGVHKGSENVIKYTNEVNTTSAKLDLDGLSVSDKYDAGDALESLDSALVEINGQRAKLGAVQSRMETVIGHLSSQTESLTEATSRLADTDVAEAISTVKRAQIIGQYQVAALQLANESTQNSLRLIA